jgi:predicted phosphodiesterase
MRLAVLADIHGNLPALEAVLCELERLQPDHVILDGDLINAVPFSVEVLAAVRARDWVVVRGNHEFYLLDFGTARAQPGSEDPVRWGQLHWLRQQISDGDAAYLGMLPDERTLYLPGSPPIRVCHGVPGRNRVGFYAEQPAEAVARELAGIGEQTVISAHTHVQVDRHIRVQPGRVVDFFSDPHRDAQPPASDGEQHWHVINPGSVGLPLNGDPSAQFAILDSVPETVEPGGWRATHYRVAYDRRPALDAFTTSGVWVAGDVITELFYWELVTAEPEIVSFYRWAHMHGQDVEREIEDAFRAYQAATQRGRYVAARNPSLHVQQE